MTTASPGLPCPSLTQPWLTHIQVVLHGRVQHHQVSEERAQIGDGALDDTLWHRVGGHEQGPVPCPGLPCPSPTADPAVSLVTSLAGSPQVPRTGQGQASAHPRALPGRLQGSQLVPRVTRWPAQGMALWGHTGAPAWPPHITHHLLLPPLGSLGVHLQGGKLGGALLPGWRTG